jgi:hypothetical protein
MTNVLILATLYDKNSFYTYQWAAALRSDLARRKNTTCLLYDASAFYSVGTGLPDAVSRADFVIFYGHGSNDAWIALPEFQSASTSVAAAPLVDSNTVKALDGRGVYAGCCWSLNGLGQSYGAMFPSGAYIGYSHEFGFEEANEGYFKDVVNQSIVSFITGDPSSKVVGDLQSEWRSLRDRFASGSLKHRPNAVMAAYTADLNEQRIGKRP